MKQHKWHKEIKAWADGAEIECCTCSVNGKDLWTYCLNPTWEVDDDYAYRIKPQPKEPQYLYAYETSEGIKMFEKELQAWVGHIIYVGKIKLEQDDD